MEVCNSQFPAVGPRCQDDFSNVKTARQTVTFLTRRFREAGIRPDLRHGQNFLIDLNLLDILVKTARVGKRDVILEVGTGLGSLTSRLAELAGDVVSVEIDPRLHRLASEELFDLPNVTLLHADALRNKNQLNPAVLSVVREKLEAEPHRRVKLVANLPYNVATPILSNLLSIEPVPLTMTATVQLELAQRIAAPPGVKDYSALSVWMQALCDVEIVRTIPPQSFWPRPKVHSAILHVVPDAKKRARIADLDHFHQFVRTLFQHRRKLLRGTLAAMLKGQLSKDEVDALLAPLELAADARAEQLPVETLLALAEAVRRRLQAAGGDSAARG